MGYYELYHASNRKHKYSKKIGNRYFYTQEEIAAYLKEKKNAVDDIGVGTVTTPSAGKAKPIGIKVHSDKRREFDKNVAKSGYLIDKDGRPYTREYYHNEKGVYVKDKKITAYSRKGDSTKTHTADLDAPRKAAKHGRKKLKTMTKRSIRSLKKQASRGKKALDKWYTKTTSPNVTVTYDEAKLK